MKTRYYDLKRLIDLKTKSYTLDDLLSTLSILNASGKKVYVDFNGVRLFSDNIDFNQAYLDVYGVSKKIYSKFCKRTNDTVDSIEYNLKDALNREYMNKNYDNYAVLMETFKIVNMYCGSSYQKNIQDYFNKLDLSYENKLRISNALYSGFNIELTIDDKDADINNEGVGNNLIHDYNSNRDEYNTNIKIGTTNIVLHGNVVRVAVYDFVLELLNKIFSFGEDIIYGSIDELEVDSKIKIQIINTLSNLSNIDIYKTKNKKLEKKNNIA